MRSKNEARAMWERVDLPSQQWFHHHFGSTDQRYTHLKRTNNMFPAIGCCKQRCLIRTNPAQCPKPVYSIWTGCCSIRSRCMRVPGPKQLPISAPN